MKKLICGFLVGFVILATAGLAGAITITFDDIGAGKYYTPLIIYDGSGNPLGTISSNNSYLEIADYNNDGNYELNSTPGSPAHVFVNFDVPVISFSTDKRSASPSYTETVTYGSPTIASVELCDTSWTIFFDNFDIELETTGGNGDGGDGDDNPTGGDGNGDSNPTGVPEPATVLLLGAGLVGLAGVKRTFKK